MALQRVADQLAHRQRQVAVGATILERDRSAVLQPIEDHRLAQNDAAAAAPADLVIVGRDVPVVPEEHGGFLHPCARAGPCAKRHAFPITPARRFQTE